MPSQWKDSECTAQGKGAHLYYLLFYWSYHFDFTLLIIGGEHTDLGKFSILLDSYLLRGGTKIQKQLKFLGLHLDQETYDKIPLPLKSMETHEVRIYFIF